MYKKDNMVLDISLQDGEKVLFVEERNVQRGSVIYSIVAILCPVAGIFGVKTVIVPLVALVVISLCVYFRIRPSSDIPVGWVLTNRYFIQIYLDDKNHHPLIVDVENLKNVEADRDEHIESGGEIIADIVMLPIKLIFNGIRDAILNRHKKVTKSYWRSTKKFYLHTKIAVKPLLNVTTIVLQRM